MKKLYLIFALSCITSMPLYSALAQQAGPAHQYSCHNCGNPASKMCTRCKAATYCSRECQLAHWKNHIDLCKKLVQNKTTEFPAPQKRLLNMAVFARDIKLCRALLLEGNDPNEAFILEGAKFYPLTLAAEIHQRDMCVLLLQNGADVNLKTKDGTCALLLAAQDGNTDLCALFLKHGANPNAARDDGYTALHLAAQYGHYTTCALLLQHDANVNALTVAQQTPLLRAVYNNHPHVCRLLLEHGARVDIPFVLAIELDNPSAHITQTALMHAAASGYTEICELLLKHGAIQELNKLIG